MDNFFFLLFFLTVVGSCFKNQGILQLEQECFFLTCKTYCKEEENAFFVCLFV